MAHDVNASPPPSAENLQKKLIQLSLDIEDKIKSIELLNDALSNEDRNGSTKHKELEDEYQAKFQNNARENTERHAALLEACDRSINQKKELASKVEGLLKEKKETKQAIIKAVENIRNKKKSIFDKEHSKWLDGAKEREEKWLDQKMKEIRERTVRGLEPEVKSIVQKHKIECARVEADCELQKKRMMMNLEREMDTKRSDAFKAIDEKSAETLRTIKESLVKRTSQEQERHTRNLTKLRNQISQENDSQRAWFAEQMKKIAEFHANQIRNVRASEANRLDDMRSVCDKEKETISKKCKLDLDDLFKTDAASREEWAAKVVDDLMKEGMETSKREQTRLQQERDVKIDSIIRQGQKEILEFEESLTIRLQEESNELKYAQSYILNISRERKEQWNRQHSSSLEKIKYLVNETENQEESRTFLDIEMDQIGESIRNIREARKKGECSLLSQLKDIAEAKELDMMKVDEKRIKLEEEIRKNEKEEVTKQSEHRDLVDSLIASHEKSLESIEQRVKDSLTIIGKKRSKIVKHIKEQEIHLEHMHQMISEYQKKMPNQKDQTK